MITKSQWHKGMLEWEIDPGTMGISVVFSWDVPKAMARAVWLRSIGFEVRVGGPAAFMMRKQLAGIGWLQVGGDIPDAVQRHNPDATFASRGCPVGCYFCIVPAMEGKEFTLLPNFEPRPILCDNNLSALPADYQDHIIDRYLSSGMPLLDANSGFEPKTFDDVVLKRWEAINKGPWRFAYDETEEGPDVERVCKMLRGYPAGRKRVYVLIGNESPQDCLDRIYEVIHWGAEPHVQPIMKLTTETKTPWVRKDLGWNHQKLIDMGRWANRWIWRTAPFHEYERSFAAKRIGQASLPMVLT